MYYTAVPWARARKREAPSYQNLELRTSRERVVPKVESPAVCRVEAKTENDNREETVGYPWPADHATRKISTTEKSKLSQVSRLTPKHTSKNRHIELLVAKYHIDMSKYHVEISRYHTEISKYHVETSKYHGISRNVEIPIQNTLVWAILRDQQTLLLGKQLILEAVDKLKASGQQISVQSTEVVDKNQTYRQNINVSRPRYIEKSKHRETS